MSRLRAFWDSVNREPTDDPEVIWAFADALGELARSDALVDFVEYELSRTLADPHASIPRSRETMLEVFATRLWSLNVHIHAPRPAGTPALPIRSYAEHILLAVVRGTLALRTYRIPGGPADNAVFSRDVRLRDGTESALGPGAISFWRAGEDAVELLPPAASSVTLSLVRRRVVPLRWAFDPATLGATQATAADVSDKRFEFAARILAMLPSPRSAEALAHLALHDARHYVRWSALRELHRLDEARGLSLLRTALRDPHPHVRNAARRTLDRLEPSPSRGHATGDA